MNYKEMLDQFEYFDKRLSHLENENKYLKERVQKLEFLTLQAATVKGPGFTPGTLPETWPNIPPGQFWSSTTELDPRYKSESLL